MDFDHNDPFDDYDGHDNCPKCGEPLTSDEDGDGVMTAPVYFCENCGDDEDPLHNEQSRSEGGG